MEKPANRNVLIDLARVICAIAVIAVHTRPWTDTNYYFGHFVSNVAARLAVPLFFMFAGYFLYIKFQKESRPVDYLKKYVLGLCKIYLVWSLVYFPYDFSKLLRLEHSWWGAMQIYAYLFFTTGGHFYLWFFPALIYSALIIGIFYIKKKIAWLRAGVVVLYVIGLAGEPYYGWFGSIPDFAGLYNIVQYLGTSRSALFFGLPFMVLGFSDRTRLKEAGNRAFGAGFLVSFILLALESFYLDARWHVSGYNLYIFLILAVFCLFGLFMKNSISLPKINSKNLRDMSLLLYCSHGLFLIFVEEYLPKSFHNFDRFIICLSLTVVFSALILKSDRIRKAVI